jgi:hypothetical protein
MSLSDPFLSTEGYCLAPEDDFLQVWQDKAAMQQQHLCAYAAARKTLNVLIVAAAGLYDVRICNAL